MQFSEKSLDLPGAGTFMNRPDHRRKNHMRYSKPVLAFLAVAVGFALYLQFRKPSVSPAPGDPILTVSVPELTGPAANGAKTYAKYCQSCHGVNAAGQKGVAPPLVHKIYEPNHHGDQAFYSAALNGAIAHHWPFGNMPPVEGIKSEEIAEIIAYVRAMQQANGIF